MMQERVLFINYSTIHRWVVEYAPTLNRNIRKYIRRTNDSWRMDETYIKLNGKWIYLYRAVDSKGNTIDFWLSKNRDKKSAKKFLKKALKSTHNQMPRVITTDKYIATEMAILEEKYYGDLSCITEHRMIKYLNNVIEQDHRHIKRITNHMLGFKSFRPACSTIAGIEVMHMIHKGQVGTSSVAEEVTLIKQLFGVA